MPPEPMKIAELELLAHRTWPCRQESTLGAWTLRTADGFTRRANSCLPIGNPSMPITDAVDQVESWYRDRRIEPCFKILPGIDPELDALLASQGWTVATPSRTLLRKLVDAGSAPAAELSASAIPDVDWLRTVSLWDGESPDKSRRHAELAMRVQSAGFLRWTTSEGVLAVGLVAMDGLDSFLYDVVVHPERRGRGVGRSFCLAAMAWAAQCGIRSMALQVLESNTVARALYASLGFTEHHPYHYRIRPSCDPTCGC